MKKQQFQIGDLVSIEGLFKIEALEKKFDGNIYAKLESQGCNYLVVCEHDLVLAPQDPETYPEDDEDSWERSQEDTAKDGSV